ncbi:hypothetical protein [Luteolibacter marinus]|uniref:hypothetical protein n=1 Tax=Luteolibacter marinus TaxID=2776705 RepID=UPI001D02C822|nr:hypothetical protein [Luteolibacter marinus]
MKVRRNRALLSLCAALVGYIAWISWPHIGEVDVANHAGVTKSDIEQIVHKLEGDGMFSGRRELATIGSSLIDPRSRPKYFVEIEGTSEAIVITAGYIRGELWGGGPVVGAKKNGLWVFEPYSALWKS